MAFCFYVGFIFSSHAETIKVVTEHIPPFQIQTADNQLAGFTTEVVNALFAITGDKPDYHVLPWSRAYNTALAEKNVMIFSIARTNERAPLFHWIGDLHYLRFYFWGLEKAFPEPISSVEELEKYTIAATESYNSEQYLKKHKFREIHHVARNPQALAMLYLERVDLVLLNDTMLTILEEQSSLPKQQTKKLFEAKEINSHLSIAFNKRTDPKIVRRFKAAFKTLESSGKLQEIKSRWQQSLQRTN